MPRSFGRFTTSILMDTGFTSLTTRQQAVYFHLGLQPDVSAAGLLGLTPRRWASFAADLTRDVVELELRALAEHPHRHVVIDDDTEELLIRKFIKWDEGWKNTQKRLPVVIDAVAGIRSVHIRDIAVDELRKIAVGDMASAEQRNAVSRSIRRFEGLGVTSGEYMPEPETSIQEREPLGADAAEPPPIFCDEHPNGTTEPCGPCGTRRRAFDAWHAADAIRQTAARDEERRIRRDCKRCNDQGILEHPESGEPLGRCDHSSNVIDFGRSA